MIFLYFDYLMERMARVCRAVIKAKGEYFEENIKHVSFFVVVVGRRVQTFVWLCIYI